MNIKHAKVKQAVTSLTFNNPFFASIALQLEYIEDMKCDTFWTDGKKIGYNSNFADSLSFDEVTGVIVHELYHVFLLHHSRMGKRDVEIYNQAADYVINYDIIRNGFKLPKGVLIDPRFNKCNVEDAYRILYSERAKKEKDEGKDVGENEENKGAPDCGFGEVRECKDCDPKEVEENSILMGKMAESAAKLCGKMPAGLDRMLSDARKTKTAWQEILNNFINETVAKNYDFMRPNKRFMAGGLVLPSLHSKTIGKVVIAVDTSGSVSPDELTNLMAEISAILDGINESKDNAEIDIVYFDSIVTGHEVYDGSAKLKPKGGGGTDFKAPFDYINNKNFEPDFVIVLTDGYCSSFPAAPDYPVLWALTVSYSDSKMPFGDVMKLVY